MFFNDYDFIEGVRLTKQIGTRLIESIELHGSGDSLILGRNFIEEKLKQAEVSDDIIPLVIMSSDEAASNVVKHFYEFDSEKKYVITVSVSAKKIIILIESYGKKINLRSTRKMNLDKHFQQGKQSGLGMYIMHTLMDEVTYHYVEKMNVIKLVKYQ